MPLLEMRSIVKEFPGVRALDGVSFALEKGQFHALVGENGAGKSTLMKVLSGVYPHGTFDGEIVVDGTPRHFAGVRDSESAGVAVIYQELSLVNELTVAENIYLGREPSRFGIIDRRDLYRSAARLLDELHLKIDPHAEAGTLGIGQQQIVEIAKALSQDARVLVLDEPTAALTESEVDTLFEILGSLKAKGVGLVYISHKLDEVFRASDRITVLRDGRTVGSYARGGVNRNALIAAMVGREVGDIFPKPEHHLGEVALEARGVTVFSNSQPAKRLVDNVAFTVRRGEVLGIAGLMGSGRSELLSAIFGAWTGNKKGDVCVDGRRINIESPADAIAHGIGFVTEDRQRFGLVADQTIADNITLSALPRISGRLLTNDRRETAAAASSMQGLRIRALSPSVLVNTLSGGNQQKVVLGKWLLTRPKVLLLDEPTRGIDVGAKQEIYTEINKLASDGLAIVLVSSELPEVLGLADRVLVMHEGRVTGEFARDEATPESVMAAATGEFNR